MSLTHYLSEVKERAEYASGREYLDTPVHESQLDVERLVRICEAQAEALEKCETAIDHAIELDYFNPGGSTEMLMKEARRGAREALSTADLIAKGELP